MNPLAKWPVIQFDDISAVALLSLYTGRDKAQQRNNEYW